MYRVVTPPSGQFGFSPEYKSILRRLSGEEWHISHEDIVSALDKLRDIDAVDVLYNATQIIPSHLDFDDARALAVKAIWALGNLGTAAAKEKLEMIAGAEHPILRANAFKQLRRLNGDPEWRE